MTNSLAAQTKSDFPLLAQQRELVYLDSAASAQKPQVVLDAMDSFYTSTNANIHRGVYKLSQDATRAYDDARIAVQRFLNAALPEEIIFVRGATEGINLIAQSFGRMLLQSGDEIVLSELEHHSNIVPWQLLAESVGAKITVLPVNDAGDLQLDLLPQLLTSRTKLLAVNHVSNALGTVNPIKEITAICHQHGVAVVVDGAQAVPHMPVDVQALGCDFYVFSGHKVYGPMGIGAVYGRAKHLAAMPPYQGGGDMIASVSFAKTTFQEAPEKFEAGTPNVAGAVGLAAALSYMEKLGKDAIAAHETELLKYAVEKLGELPGVTLIGTPEHRAGAISFLVDGMHPSDLGTFLDQQHIAIRTGHHCAQPLLAHFGLTATARVSFGVYNSTTDVDLLIAGIKKAQKFFT